MCSASCRLHAATPEAMTLDYRSQIPGLCGRRHLLPAGHQGHVCPFAAGDGMVSALRRQSLRLVRRAGIRTGTARAADHRIQHAAGRRNLFRRGPAACIHAVRFADGADSVRHYRRRRRQRQRDTWFHARFHLRDGHGLVYTAGRHRCGGSWLAVAGDIQCSHGYWRCSQGMLFVILALGMFGMFELQMPSAFKAELATISGKQKKRHRLSARSLWERFRP